MPVYEYECTACKKQFEIVQKITDDPVATCPECTGALKKMISNTSFVLKGTGWYVTDYARNSKKAEASTDTSPGKKTADKAETKSEAKADAKKENKDSSTETAVSK
jgi:putative FmdB family regulatory protein